MYAVAWQRGSTGRGSRPTYIAYNQEAYDAECAALARHQRRPQDRRRQRGLHTIIITDIQTAIRRMASGEPGPGQMYAIQARRHIATLRRARPSVTIEIRWCPAHKESRGMRKPTRGRSPRRKNRTRAAWNGWRGSPSDATSTVSRTPQTSNLKRGISGRNGPKLAGGLEAESPAGSTGCRASSGQTRRWRVTSSKRLASRFCQPKTGHCLTGQHLGWTKNLPTTKCWWCLYRRRRGTTCSKTVPAGSRNRGSCGRRCGRGVAGGKVGSGSGAFGRYEVRPAGADFLSITDVGRQALPRLRTTQRARRLSGSSGSGEREGRGGRLRSWVPVDGEEPLFLPTPSLMASAEGESGWGALSFVLSFVFFLLVRLYCVFPLLLFPWCVLYLLGTGLGGGQGEACTCPHCADSGEETVQEVCSSHSTYIG